MARFRDLSHVCRMHVASAGLSAPRRPAKNAPVAQLDRALGYESRGQEFESLRARQKTLDNKGFLSSAGNRRQNKTKPNIVQFRETTAKCAGEITGVACGVLQAFQFEK